MSNSLVGKSRKKTAFIPRLAYGCVGVGMGVVPFAALSAVFGCSSNAPSVGIGIELIDADSVGIRPAFRDASSGGTEHPDASAQTDAVSVGIHPAIPDSGSDDDASSEDDASSVGIVPHVPQADAASDAPGA